MSALNSPWVSPSFSRGQVDRAGRLLATSAESGTLSDRGVGDVINNWRSSHSFPLNTLQMGLRNKATSICDAPIVAQRLKRVSSIAHKLQRFQGMQLSRMQDIGGARAVLPTIKDVDELRKLYSRSSARHKRANEKDYVRQPKASGYRGLHLVYRYHSDRNDVYNGLQIELQLRTRTQHAWATAVETVGTFLGQSLKSSQGREDWLRFFELIGSGFALVDSGTIADNVPGERDALLAEIQKAALNLHVKETLEAFRHTLRVVCDRRLRGFKYFLLVLQPNKEKLNIRAFRGGELRKATDAYLAEERDLVDTSGDSVLVSSDSLESLRRAFPNYFGDTRRFVQEMDSLLS